MCLVEKIHKILVHDEVVHGSKIAENQSLKWVNTSYIGIKHKLEIPMQRNHLLDELDYLLALLLSLSLSL